MSWIAISSIAASGGTLVLSAVLWCRLARRDVRAALRVLGLFGLAAIGSLAVLLFLTSQAATARLRTVVPDLTAQSAIDNSAIPAVVFGGGALLVAAILAGACLFVARCIANEHAVAASR